MTQPPATRNRQPATVKSRHGKEPPRASRAARRSGDPTEVDRGIPALCAVGVAPASRGPGRGHRRHTRAVPVLWQLSPTTCSVELDSPDIELRVQCWDGRTVGWWLWSQTGAVLGVVVGAEA